MSEHDEHESDGLDSALRVLAADGEAQPDLSGAQIRRRGEARGRRRRTAGAAAAAVALIVGAAVGVPRMTGADEDQREPATTSPSPSLPTPAALPAASIDTEKGVLIVNKLGGRSRPIDVWMKGRPFVRMMVESKYTEAGLTADLFPGDKYGYTARWVIKLTGAGDSPLYIAQAASRAYPSSNVISVGSRDAKWVYDQLEVGDLVVPD